MVEPEDEIGLSEIPQATTVSTRDAARSGEEGDDAIEDSLGMTVSIYCFYCCSSLTVKVPLKCLGL